MTILKYETENAANETATDMASDTPSANKKIKDGVFRLLFGKPENAAELYYTLTGIKCTPDEVQIMTITTVVSGEMKNDLAFVVKDKVLFVGEHQSTPNKNMPIRILMYLGQLYEKLIKMEKDREEKFLYSTSILKLPKPEFAVFYNGVTKKPELEILKLSAAFGEDEGTQKEDNSLGLLRLEVPVYNINKGMNTELFKKGEKLRQYSEFIAKLRELQKAYKDYETAVKKAVNYCINNDILSDFLRENGGKIVSILSTEYNADTHKRVFAEEYAEEKVIEIAKTLLKIGDPIDKVIMVTGLSREVIEGIQI